MRKAPLAIVPLLLILAACGGGGSEGDDGLNGETPASSPVPAPRVSPTPLHPPLEGAERIREKERINYREDPGYRLLDPADLPAPSASEEGPEFYPPETPECPADWEILFRPNEGFHICYPSDWVIDGTGYVSGGVEDKWYSLGFFRYAEEGDQSAHVSVYVTGPFSQPFTYVEDCGQAYQVTLSGQPASLCPDNGGVFPEAKIIAYHVRTEEWDYFIQIVPHFQIDPDKREYLQTWSDEDVQTAIGIAHSFQLN